MCGNGTREGSEQCDAGANNGRFDSNCNSQCELAHCGDGEKQGAEQCDDGNGVDGDACRNNCTINSCGNGTIEPGEQCDDGNTSDFDDCNALCQNSFCGNNRVDGYWNDGAGEECDYGADRPGDNCDANCHNVVYCCETVYVPDQCEDSNQCQGQSCVDGQCNFSGELAYEGCMTRRKPLNSGSPCSGGSGSEYEVASFCSMACQRGGLIGGGGFEWGCVSEDGCFPSDTPSAGGNTFSTEEACVNNAAAICEDMPYNTIGGTGTYGYNTFGGGGAAGPAGGGGEPGGAPSGGASSDGDKECGRDQCMTATACTFAGGQCGESCGGADGKPAGCCCTQNRNGPSGAAGSGGSNSSDDITILGASNGSLSSGASSAQTSSASSNASQCNPYLTFDCPLCPNGVASKLQLTATGFTVNTLFQGQCTGDAECAKRNELQWDKVFLEYRGGCQWSTNAGGETCDEDIRAADWALHIEPGKAVQQDGTVVDILQAILTERGGAVFKGPAHSFCEFAYLDAHTPEVAGACYDSLDPLSHVSIRMSCRAPSPISSRSSVSSSRSSSSASLQSSSSLSVSARLSSGASAAAVPAGAASAGMLAGGQQCPAGTNCPMGLCAEGLCVCSGNADCPLGQQCAQGLCRLLTCGNATVESPEQCDDGNAVNNDGCTNACRVPLCGDGILSGSEQCDEGVYNGNAPDGCRASCKFASCGDNVVDTGEACDDGNRDTKDRCANNCRLGLGEFCGAAEECVSGLCVGGICMGEDVCGNGVQENNEWCDDGNEDDAACTAECLWGDDHPCALNEECASGICRKNRCVRNGFCGDGILDALLGEECDQKNANSNTIANRCRLNCRLAHLGDGVVDRGEECDDGNLEDGDGCSRAGRLEQVAALPTVLELPQGPLMPPFGMVSGSPLTGGILDAQLHGGAALNSSGPAALAIMASGAAAGLAWMRRRRRR